MTQFEDAAQAAVPTDPLELLVPEGGHQRELAARWTAALRLVRSAARNRQSPSAGVNPHVAQQILERTDRDADHSALETLLGQHLEACLPTSTWFAWSTGGTAPEAWAQLGEATRAVPPVPAPGESALSVARRLLVLAEEASLEPGRLAHWCARLAWVEGDAKPLAGLGCGGSLSDRAALHLECGDLGAARSLLDSSAQLDARGRLLLAACQVFLDVRAFPTVRQALHPLAGLPQPLAELLHALGHAGPLADVPGPARASGHVSAQGANPVGTGGGDLTLDRGAIGASVLLVLALDRQAGGQLKKREVQVDLDPSLARSFAEWKHARARAWRIAGEPEQTLMATGEVVRWHRQEGEPALQGALDSGGAALVQVPLTDSSGVLVGWLHLEFAHHLVPAHRMLMALAREALAHMGGEGLGQSTRDGGGGPGSDQVRDSSDAPADSGPANVAADFLGGVFQSLVAELGMKTTRRRWFGFGLEDGEPRLAATGGRFGGCGPTGGGFAGGAQALRRAADSAAVVTWDRDAELHGVDVRSASGVVMPLVHDGQTLALFVVESLAQRDLRAADIERIGRQLSGRSACMRAAVFRSAHKAAYGWDPHLPTDVGDFAAFAQRLGEVALHRAPVVLVGASGTGKDVLAYWVHEHRRRAGRTSHQRLVAWSARSEWSGSRAATWVAAPERMGEREQAALLQCLQGPPGQRRDLVVTTEVDPRTRPSRLEPALSRALCRVVLRVPDLAARREELPGWIDAIFRRLCQEESMAMHSFSDEARALLWRQPWIGNLRDLDLVLHGLLLDAPGAAIEVDEVAGALARAGLEVVRRLPSRAPSRADILAALATTRTGTGRSNKTRAALYLGWDPDTLVARANEFGISTDEPVCPMPWTGPKDKDSGTP